MLAQGRRDLTHDRAARPSGIVFGVLGALLTIAGVVSVVTGMPSAAHGLAPLAGIGTLGTRYGDFSLLLSAGLAAIGVSS